MSLHRNFVKAGAVVAALLAAPPPAPAQWGPVKVLTARVEQRELPSTVTLVGKVEPLRRSTLGSEVAGIVAQMPVRGKTLPQPNSPGYTERRPRRPNTR